MERADIEKLFAFTDYGWREYEETIRPLGDELLTKPAPRFRLACTPRRPRTYQLGVRPLAGRPVRNDRRAGRTRYLMGRARRYPPPRP
jgi:hypothetical protein